MCARSNLLLVLYAAHAACLQEVAPAVLMPVPLPVLPLRPWLLPLLRPSLPPQMAALTRWLP
jgi:hypothetical protein